MTFEKVDLGTVCKFFNNSRKPVTRSNRVAGEYRYFGAAGIQDYVSEYLFDGDFILVGEDGTVITEDDRPVVQQVSGKFWVNNHAHVIQPNEMEDYDYLYFAISSTKVRDLVTGAVQPKLSMTNLKQLQIHWAEESVARLAIGSVLRNLDSKIAANNALSKTLEDIAQTIFKSWFIDFDPVKAKMAGEKPAGMDEVTAALFPDSMEESELGLIPKGWKVERFGEVNNLLMGQSPPGDTYNSEGEGLPFYQGRTDFGFRFPKQRIFCTQENRVALPGEILVSVRAPVGDVNQAIEKCIIGRGVASALHKSNSGAYTFSLLKSLYPRLAYYNGEGTVFGAINRNDFNNMLIVEPPASLVDSFEASCGPMNAKIRSLFLSTEALIQLRDSLLPRLISGELQIPEKMLAS
jgi:type I restriction enzyme S subunit